MIKVNLANKYSLRGCEHEIRWEKCPAFGKTNCLKKKNFERVEENEINMQVFSVKNKNKNLEKNCRKEKRHTEG